MPRQKALKKLSKYFSKIPLGNRQKIHYCLQNHHFADKTNCPLAQLVRATDC